MTQNVYWQHSYHYRCFRGRWCVHKSNQRRKQKNLWGEKKCGMMKWWKCNCNWWSKLKALSVSGNNEFMTCWWFSNIEIDLCLRRTFCRPFGIEIHTTTPFPSLSFFVFLFFQNCFSADYCFHRFAVEKKKIVLISKLTGENSRWLCGYWFCWTEKTNKGVEKKTRMSGKISFSFNFFLVDSFFFFFFLEFLFFLCSVVFIPHTHTPDLNTSLVCHNKLMCVSIRAVGIRTTVFCWLLQMICKNTLILSQWSLSV